MSLIFNRFFHGNVSVMSGFVFSRTEQFIRFRIKRNEREQKEGKKDSFHAAPQFSVVLNPQKSLLSDGGIPLMERASQ